jgi:hypothetical protein
LNWHGIFNFSISQRGQGAHPTTGGTLALRGSGERGH